MANRRKSSRFRIPLDVQFMLLGGVTGYSSGKIRNFSGKGFCFASNTIEGKSNDPIMVKFDFHDNYMSLYALGDIVWKRQVFSKSLAGVKIRGIDKESRNKRLAFPFNLWVKNFRSNKENFK